MKRKKWKRKGENVLRIEEEYFNMITAI